MAHSWTLGDFTVHTADGDFNYQQISDMGWIVAQDVQVNSVTCIYCDQSITWQYPRTPHRVQDIIVPNPNHDCPNEPVDPPADPGGGDGGGDGGGG